MRLTSSSDNLNLFPKSYFLDLPQSAAACPPSIAISDHQICETEDSSTSKALATKGIIMEAIPSHTFFEVRSFVIM